MKTLAELKRTLKIGDALTMVRHDWYPTGKLIGLPRYIIAKQSNAIALSPDSNALEGSWLYWPKASDIHFTDTGFMVVLDPKGNTMEYTLSPTEPS